LKEELDVKSLREKDPSNLDSTLMEPLSAGESEVLSEGVFKRLIALERKRTERSKDPFLLMLLEAGDSPSSETREALLDRVASALLSTGRETDVIGWYKDRTTVGVMYLGLAIIDRDSILNSILNRVKAVLKKELPSEQFKQITISFHFFPDEWDQSKPGSPIDLALYPDIAEPKKDKRVMLAFKRLIDIVGSAAALLVCLPLLWLIALAIKATSKGPVLFSQTRVGQYGKRFIVLKFRTMYTDIDRSIHKKFVTTLIADKEQSEPSVQNGKPIYKLTNDKRITKIGSFLRRTSLDELPQFFNVLRGEMSLVGPRPAVRYEVAAYQTWHRRRVLEFKPGITGLWQVEGRSKVKFDDMVRMDLHYATSWSIWLDLKLLLRTPLAVLKGTGH
jgi:lipopolysaccharide/colanic/teichoic acid biosynthesis glycosyltransferase